MGNNKIKHRDMTPAQLATLSEILAGVENELAEMVKASQKGKLIIHYSGGADARLEKTVSKLIKKS